MTTDLSKLPNYNGRPVPWIARWTGELKNEPYSYQIVRDGPGSSGHLRVIYPDHNEDREDSGVIWQREGIDRSGTPKFADVNTYRQRLAMKKRMCQVCGDKITGPITPWLLDSIEALAIDGGYELVDGDPITTTAPICEECIPIAQRYCPHLSKHGSKIWDVLEYKLWGIFGEVLIWQDGGPGRIQTSIGYDQDYGEGFSLEQVLAKQQIVQFTKYRVRS